VNLKDYVDGDGTVVHYKLRIRQRRGTLVSMPIDAVITYEFKP